MKKTFMLLALASIALTACNNAKVSEPTPATTSTQASQVATTNVQPQRAAGVWIDVRTASEYSEGHLSDTYNVEPDKLAAAITDIEPNKDAPINLYCRSGRRAEIARKILMDLGYTNVTNHGGYQELYDKGLR